MTSYDGFVIFVRTIMGIPELVLPDTSPSLHLAYNLGFETNRGVEYYSELLKDIATYNLSAHYSIVLGTEEILSKARDSSGLMNVGILSSSSDSGTSGSYSLPDYATMSALSNELSKTYYGRVFLSLNQQTKKVF